jgi:uncharacterized coiled-coil protein SlyX
MAKQHTSTPARSIRTRSSSRTDNQRTEEIQGATRAVLDDIDAMLARLETGIAREQAAMDHLLERIKLRRAA